MIDWDKPIETVDGRGAKVLSRGYWRNGETYCVVQIEDDDGNSEIVIVNPTTGYGAWSSKGQFRNARVKREGWVIKFKGKDCLWDFQIYPSEEIAVKHVPSGTVHEVVPIKWEQEQ